MFYQKPLWGKFSTPRYMNSSIGLNNSFPFCNTESKSIKSHKCGSLSKLTLFNTSGLHEQCTPRDIPYLPIAW